MLPRSQRLSGEQLNLVMEKGRVTHSTLFWLRSLKYEGKTKVATVAPQKIVKTSVGRHKLRRLMYEAIGSFFPSIETNQQIVVCAKSPATTTILGDLSKEMKILFVKSGLLK